MKLMILFKPTIFTIDFNIPAKALLLYLIVF